MNSKPETVLLVDDDQNILDLSTMYLAREGYQIASATNGLQALERIRAALPSLVVLDLMLPGMDGFEICRTLRAENNQVPIILLTARDEDVDKILGLELGADDYMTKPFNPRELAARVKAILKRTEHTITVALTTETIRLDGITIDLLKREVTNREGHKVELRRHEFELLRVLAERKGVVFTREQLLAQAWGFDFAGQTRTVDVHVAQLRSKLAGSGVIIETVTGVGYKLVA